jgi:hypothetical protein
MLLVVMAVACGRKGAPPLSSSSLWALAPPDTEVAVVLREGALPLLVRGVRVLATKSEPFLAAQVKAALATLPIDLMDDASLTAAGVDPERGAAVFVVHGHHVLVPPASDEKKVRDKLGAGWWCKEIRGRFACADAEAALATVGTSTALSDVVKAASLDLRGDIEGYLAHPPVDFLHVENPRGFWFSAHFEPGAVTLRAKLAGKTVVPPIPALTLAGGLAERRPSGILLVQGGAFMRMLSRFDVPLPGGQTSAKLLAALTGEVVAWVPSGVPARGYLKVGVKDAATVRRLLDACEDFTIEPLIVARKDGDRCKGMLRLPNLKEPIPVDAWLEDGALVFGFGEHAAKDAPRGDLASYVPELLEKKWALASWGRGLYALALPDMLGAMGGANPSMSRSVMSMLSHMTEAGMAFGWDEEGYRATFRIATTFANPDEIVTALEPLLARLAGGDASAAAEVQALAKKYPGSPLAETLQTGGPGGVIAATFVPGVVAAVAIPAFMRNARKAKTVEATTLVKRLYDGAHAYYEEGGSKRFPGPSASATPAGPCCGHPGDKCSPDASLWSKDPWKSLGFSVDDPHYYRYEYDVSGDGKSFSARALGDLDCDGVYSTFELVGSVAADGTVTSAAGMYINNDLE